MRDREYPLDPEEMEFLEKLGTSVAEQRALHSGCPAPHMLMAAQSEVLPEETSRNIREHVKKCALCRVLAQDLLDEELAAPRPQEEARIRAHVLSAGSAFPKAKSAAIGGFWLFLRRAAPIASLAAVALAVLWLGIHPTTPRSPARPVAVEPQPRAAAPSVFQLEKLPVKLGTGAVLVWRGAPRNKQEKYAAELGAALAFYNNDNFSEAAQRLTVVAEKYPRQPEAHLYLGVSELYLQQNSEAIESLKAAQHYGGKLFVDDAAWYLALGYKRASEKQLALGELEKLCRGKSAYAQKACAGIQELSAPSGANPGR
jgi:tetratricopeptide (TPR) repeat protein